MSEAGSLAKLRSLLSRAANLPTVFLRRHSSDNPNGNFNTLSGHGPDINQPRDPRNGRQGELISEDGVLTGRAAEKVVRGMQYGADVEPADFAGPHVMLASLKHYNAWVTTTRASIMLSTARPLTTLLRATTETLSNNTGTR